MARVVLINPPSPERMGSPLLGLQYVAASLLDHGCDVLVIDAAAREFRLDADAIVGRTESFQPDLIGFGLFTRWVWHAYRLAERFAGGKAMVVAGGAHATARPLEPLSKGFQVSVIGEAERVMPLLSDWADGRAALEEIPGVVFRSPDGAIRRGRPAAAVEDLDALPQAFLAQRLFDSSWYDPGGREVIPGGILTSRGCPARCTFCANYVTGRRFRYRSAGSVIAELRAWHAMHGTTFFPCWDDALTADAPRLRTLCTALERDAGFPVTWSAITRANLVTPELLDCMKRAGLVHVNFGVESGDDAILRAIKKGIRTDQVVRALEWAKERELSTACNFMLGFPQETPAALERTLRFMERIAPLVDTFSTLGVVVPFPATPIYEEHHGQFGFTDWWLREDYAHYEESPPIDEFDRFYRHYIDDRNLDLDFFHYDEPRRAMIRECLKFKAETNLRRMGLLRDPVFQPEAGV